MRPTSHFFFIIQSFFIIFHNLEGQIAPPLNYNQIITDFLAKANENVEFWLDMGIQVGKLGGNQGKPIYLFYEERLFKKTILCLKEGVSCVAESDSWVEVK